MREYFAGHKERVVALGMDRDKLHSERVQRFVDGLLGEGPEVESSLFVSELVDGTIERRKIFLSSYNKEAILGHLPYHDVIYVSICPCCIDVDREKDFRMLVERGAIIPILIAPYDQYSEDLVDFIYLRDHVSFHEFWAFRALYISAHSRNRLCQHCVGEWRSRASIIIKADPKLKNQIDHVGRLVQNLHPYVAPDFELLDEYEKALKDRNISQLRLISGMSESIRIIRDVQAFNSPLDIRDSQILALPIGVTSEIDEAISLSEKLSSDMAKGLGLRIPIDVEIPEYLEIVSDLRPQITEVVSRIVSSNSGGGNDDQVALQRAVMAINAEVERLQASRRSMFLEVMVDIYSKNSTLLNAVLVAGSLGLAGTLAGCVPAIAGGVSVTGAVASAASSVAKRKNLLPESEAAQKFARKIQADLQPSINHLLSLYLGGSSAAVSIMSLRQQIDRRAITRKRSRGGGAIAQSSHGR